MRGESFELYPDFPSGGLCDVTRYNDGLRGGAVKVRARINKIDKRTLAITEIPYGTTTESIKESIIKANDKGKIKIKKVDDNTSDQVEIIIHVSNDESSDRTIDALYAFTDCEVSISPNSCVIMDDKPHFMGVHEILRRCADRTRELLRRELEIRLEELEQDWHMSSLEKIFIENKIYQRMEEATSREAAYAAVDEGLKPFAHLLRREITLDDVVKLTELRMIRISRYDSFKADEHVKSVEQEIAQVKRHLATLTDFTIAYFRRIKEKYGRGRERRTELREFDSIEATKVVVANAKLYVDRAEGFFGIGPAMRKDEFVCDCSDIDDVIVVTKEGKYVITKVSEKAFFAKNIYYIGIFKRNDERTIYNVLYRDGRGGPLMMKRCAIKGITRDREYDLTKGTPRSEILYMSVNPNGEAEVLKVYFKPRPRLKKLIVDLNFGELAIKGRQSQGNLFTRYAIHKIVLKERGASTLGGISVWYDDEIRQAQHGRPGRVAGRVLGRRQADRDDGQGPLLYDGLRSGRPLPGGYDPRREVRSGPHILGRLFRRRAELLLRQALHGRAERPDAEFRRRGGRSVARGDQRRPLSPAAGRLCGTQCRPARRYDRRGRVHRRQESPGQRQARDDARGRPDRLYRSDRAGASSRGTVRRGRSGGRFFRRGGRNGCGIGRLLPERRARRRKSPSPRITWRAIRSSSTWPAKRRAATGDKWNCFERRLAGDGRPSFRKGLPFDECCARAVRTARRRGLGAC